MTALKRVDLALWNLPRPLRKVAVAPIALACGVAEAWENGARDFRYGWRAIMEAVEERPAPPSSEQQAKRTAA